MDYEKMYNEALKRAKKFEEKYGGGYAEYIFPELAESEDERIRIELKEAFDAYDIDSSWNGIPVKSVIAWLEKQKERVPENEETGTRKEQKPEWSEEDEQLLGFIYDLLADSLWNSRYAMSRDECLDRLTSLRQRLQPRPSWKPSEDLEEEMDRFFEEMPIQEHENIFEDTYHMIARHFYELGLNARKEEKK